MISDFEYWSKEISRIQFHTNLSKKDKQQLISRCEKRMARLT